MERINLCIQAPKERPDPNWSGWDLESFSLSEHLFDLIESYGIDVIEEELHDCIVFLNKKIIKYGTVYKR